MSDNTARLRLPEIAQMQEMTGAQINDALLQLDALCSPSVMGLFVNDPPASPVDGDTYVTGAAPTGAWAGYAYKIAYCLDGGWRMFTPFDGLAVHRADTDSLAIYRNGQWVALGALLAGPEVSVASAAVCDLGAAGGLRVQITGATTVTGFGTSANVLRLVRFAGALTLVHDTTSLSLPGGADIVTGPGDCAIFASDGSGNWRCLSFTRADGHMVNMNSPAFTGTLTGPDGGTWNSTGFDNAAAMRFSIGGSERGRFDSGGSFLVGTTISGGWSGNFASEVRATGNALSAYSTGSGTNNALTLRVDSVNNFLAQMWFGGSTVGNISTDGTNTAYNTTSDARLKTVLPEQVNYRAAIKALWVGDFAWKAGGGKAFGVLAQQAYEHMPHHMGVFRPAAADGQWHASSEPFGHLALWGVKDLYAMAEELAARVAALEASHAAG